MKKQLRTSSRPALVDLRTVAGNGRGRGVAPAGLIPTVIVDALLQTVTGGGRGRGLIGEDPTIGDAPGALDG